MIKASGEVKETIEQGAYVLLTVKYGLIRLISTRADLCEQIGNVDLECPVNAGELEITKSVDLPSEIPPVRSYRALLITLNLAVDTNHAAGQVHCSGRRIHRRRRPNHLLDCYRCLL